MGIQPVQDIIDMVRGKETPFVLNWRSKKIQNKYDFSPLKEAKSAIIFLVPTKNVVNGGVISIFNLCRLSRDVAKNRVVLIATYPGKFTYHKNDKFKNDEQVYRFSQIVKYGKGLEELIIHVPEYYSEQFYSDLSVSEKKFLKSVRKLQINIMNQNLLCMPTVCYLKKLYKLTDNVTQTTGFKRYSTQEICNKFQMPLYYVSPLNNLENACVKKEFGEKKKIILYSPDSQPLKPNILEHLKDNLPDFEFRMVEDLTYEEFLEAVSEAMFCVSFGEGFDGYYIPPYYSKSIGVAVYNDIFFPNPEIKSLPFVYKTYDDLRKKLPGDIKNVCGNKGEYERISESSFAYIKQHAGNKEVTVSGLEKFYKGEATFIPNKAASDPIYAEDVNNQI